MDVYNATLVMLIVFVATSFILITWLSLFIHDKLFKGKTTQKKYKRLRRNLKK